jgi:hypothetical protein
MFGERRKYALALSLALITHIALLTDRWVMKG